MATIRYKGHHILGHTHRAIDCVTMLSYKVKEGRTVEVSEREAAKMLHLYRTAFERVSAVVEERKVSKPASNRMRSKPNTNRGAKQ